MVLTLFPATALANTEMLVPAAAPAEAFTDSSGVVWRVLHVDDAGNRLMITERIHDWAPHSINFNWSPFSQSNLRTVLNGWTLAPEVAANALTPVGVDTDVRNAPGNFNRAENEAAGRTTAGAPIPAANAVSGLFVLSISEVNQYFDNRSFGGPGFEIVPDRQARSAYLPAEVTPMLWWLRSPGAGAPLNSDLDLTHVGTIVGISGVIQAWWVNYHQPIGIRPAIWVDAALFCDCDPPCCPACGCDNDCDCCEYCGPGNPCDCCEYCGPGNPCDCCEYCGPGNPCDCCEYCGPGNPCDCCEYCGPGNPCDCCEYCGPGNPCDCCEYCGPGNPCDCCEYCGPGNPCDCCEYCGPGNPCDCCKCDPPCCLECGCDNNCDCCVYCGPGDECDCVDVLFLRNYEGAANYGVFKETTVRLGGTLPVPVAPVRAGYTFAGWYLEPETENAKDFTAYITEDLLCEDEGHLRIYARWEEVPEEPVFHSWFMQGNERGEFAPHGDITRGEVATILVRTFAPESNLAEPPATPFTDIDDLPWASSYIAWAYYHGFIRGHDDADGNRVFRPLDDVSREELSAMVARAAELTPMASIPGTGFPDANEISNWARPYVNAVIYTGWLRGDGDGNLRPLDPIVRAEAAAVIARALGRDGTINSDSLVDVEDDLRIFPDVRDTAWYHYLVIEVSHSHYFVIVTVEDEDGEEVEMELWTEITWPPSA